MADGNVLNSFLLLAGMLCMLAASYSVCYAIWMRGWEGWESWNARTGLDEHAAFFEKQDRLVKPTPRAGRK